VTSKAFGHVVELWKTSLDAVNAEPLYFHLIWWRNMNPSYAVQLVAGIKPTLNIGQMNKLSQMK